MLATAAGARAQSVENIYIAQNSSGAGSGVSCANARSLAWLNTAGSWGSGAGLVGAGDTVRFCGILTGGVTIQQSGSSGNPITFTAETGSKFSKSHWTSPVIGSPAANRSYIVIDRLTIEATASGTGQNNGTTSAITFLRCDNCEVKNNSVLNMYVRAGGSSDTNGGSYLITFDGGNNVKIHHNTANHQQYLINFGCPDTCANLEIYNNVLSHSAGPIIVSAYNLNAVINGAKIYANDISDMSNWGGSIPIGDGHYHCDGMHIVAVQPSANSAINNLEIYRNYLHGSTCVTGGGVSMTAWIYVEGRSVEYGGNGGRIQNALIYNNFIPGPSGTNGAIYCRSCEAPRFYNNTLVGESPTSGSAGIGLDSSTGVVAINNLIGNRGTGIYGALSTTWGTVDRNAYFGLHADNQFSINGCCVSFAQWKASGKDTNGWLDTTTNLKVSTSTWQLNANSILIDAATNVAPSCAGCTVDQAGNTRPQGAGWDVGSFEFMSVSEVIQPPANLRIIP